MRVIRKTMVACLLLLTMLQSFVLIAPVAVYSQVRPATTIHEEAWSSVVEKAKANLYYKYGIYASRTIAVNHPEIYLQADRLFLESVNGKALKHVLPTGGILSSTFSFGAVDLGKYQIVSYSAIYKDMPFLPTLDQRAFSIQSTLMRYDFSSNSIVPQDTITQLNKAILYYLRNVPGREVYIVLTDKESAYVIDSGLLLSVNSFKNDTVLGNLMLIFNEKSVWYPLMGRDDTGTDASLKAIVAKFVSTEKKPSLTEFEGGLIEKLKVATSLADESEENMALLAAAKTSCYYGYGESYVNETFLSLWRKALPDVTDKQLETIFPPHPAGGVDDAVIAEIIRRGNCLSPVLAYLAFTWVQEGMLTPTYRRLGFNWAVIWTLGMVGYTIDESFLSKGGDSETHAYNIASTLDVHGRENYVVRGYKAGGVAHVINYYVGSSGESVFSNGVSQSPKITPALTEAGSGGALVFLSHNERWALIVENNYVGNMPPQVAKQAMLLLKKNSPDLKGIAYIGGSTSEISVEDLAKFLDGEQARWKPLWLPWSRATTTTTATATRSSQSAATTTSSTSSSAVSPVATSTLESYGIYIGVAILAVVLVPLVVLRKRKAKSSTVRG